jgi:nucleotide-binding universal stress UspA family protein
MATTLIAHVISSRTAQPCCVMTSWCLEDQTREGSSMFSKIVVGTDGSDSAAGAVALAATIAQQTGATVHIVSAYKDADTTIAVAHVGVVAVPDSSLTAAVIKRASEELLADLAKEMGQVPVETHSVPGAPADVLIGVAEAVDADLIVVGSKGMKGPRRLLGSVPNSVAHRARCHVMIAKTT